MQSLKATVVKKKKNQGQVEEKEKKNPHYKTLKNLLIFPIFAKISLIWHNLPATTTTHTHSHCKQPFIET